MGDQTYNTLTANPNINSTSSDTSVENKPELVQGLQAAINRRYEALDNITGGKVDPVDQKSALPDNSIDDQCIQYAGSCSLDFNETAHPLVTLAAQYQFHTDLLTKEVDGATLEEHNPGFSQYVEKAINPKVLEESVEIIEKGAFPNDWSQADINAITNITDTITNDPSKFGLETGGIFGPDFETIDDKPSYPENSAPSFAP